MATATATSTDRKVKAAWNEYLEACRDARLRGLLTVVEVEEWAWARLQQELRRIHAPSD